MGKKFKRMSVYVKELFIILEQLHKNYLDYNLMADKARYGGMNQSPTKKCTDVLGPVMIMCFIFSHYL